MWEVISRFKVCPHSSDNPEGDVGDMLMKTIETKLVAAAVYSNFRTTIVNDDDIEAIDAYTVHPRGEKLILKFQKI